MKLRIFKFIAYPIHWTHRWASLNKQFVVLNLCFWAINLNQNGEIIWKIVNTWCKILFYHQDLGYYQILPCIFKKYKFCPLSTYDTWRHLKVYYTSKFPTSFQQLVKNSQVNWNLFLKSKLDIFKKFWECMILVQSPNR